MPAEDISQIIDTGTQDAAAAAASSQVDTSAADAASAAAAAASSTTTADTGSSQVTPVDDFLAKVREIGFENVESPADAQARLIQAYREQQQLQQQYAQRFRELEPLVAMGQQYFEQQRQSQQQQQQPTAPAGDQGKQPSLWPEYPQLEPATVARWRDANSQDGWRYGTPPEIRQAAETFQARVEQWTNGLIYQPQKTLQPIIQAEVEARVNQILVDKFGMDPRELVQKLDVSGEQKYVDEVLTNYGPVLFGASPVNGQIDYNRPTQLGALFLQTVAEAEQMGITSEANRYYIGLKAIAPYMQQQQTTAASQAQAASVAAAKTNHLRRAAARTGTSASVPSPTQPASAAQRQSLRQEIQAELEAVGGVSSIFG